MSQQRQAHNMGHRAAGDPVEYERRVTAFPETALLGTNHRLEGSRQ